MSPLDSKPEQVGIAHHTSRKRGTWSDKHGTPEHVIALVRQMFGRIDDDLASSHEFNKTVGARWYYSIESPCPEMIQTDIPSVIYCNPPGPSKNVIWFFDVWQEATRRPNAGAFLIYNIDHWRMLEPKRPLWALMFRKRLAFLGIPHRKRSDGANFASVLVTTKKPPKGFGHIFRWEPKKEKRR